VLPMLNGNHGSEWSLANGHPAPPRRPSIQSSRTLSSLFSGDGVWLTKNVRRLCHQCHSPFIWTETRCQDCNHAMCDQCPRDPPISPRATPPGTAAGPSAGSDSRSVSSRIRERVFKKPRIRVRYNCEVCSTLFDESTKRCGTCGHTRCNNCPRHPPRTQRERAPDPAAVEAFRRRMESMP